ncbi:protein kinase [Streptomyces sp. NPDC029674]|uniref:serine/threonine-protein kinase n=1 Tax=Streptomyces sp. NPDC029674 TaxID=3365297 RepID=UPI00384AEB49
MNGAGGTDGTGTTGGTRRANGTGRTGGAGRGPEDDGGFDLTGSGAEPLRPQDPRRIGQVPLVGRLGAGGMGRVYLGVVDGQYAAVKQMLASVVAEDRGFLRRFGQEMDNLGRLPADATAPLLASDRTAEPPWFATAYVPGITLSEAVGQRGGALPADALWLLLREAAAGLTAVHGLDMVHRDLKPSNVMLTLDGVTLIDFGIARAAEQSQLTQTGLVVGTPAYMSPEQASGKRRLTSASDIFALGLLVGYAASGRWPFTDAGEGAGEGSPLYRIVHDEPDLAPLRELDAELAELVATCLDKDPEGRPTAPELVELADGRGPSASPVWPGPVLEPLRERAAFAERIPAHIPDPATPKPTAAPAPAPVAETTPDARPPRRERRRTRIVMAAVPVVVVAAGTTLALQNLPYVTEPDRASGSTPSAAVTAPADPGQPSADSSKPASKKPKDDKDDKNGTDTKEKDKSPREGAGSGDKNSSAQKDEATGNGDSRSPGSAPDSASSNGSSSGTDTDTGSETGSGTGTGTGSSGSSGSGDSPSSPSAGPFRLKNADNGACLTQVYGSAGDGSCGDASASWKTVSAENNSFKVVNKQSGSCLVANMLGQAVFVGDCTQGSARLWRWGSGGTLKSTSNGGCLDLAYGGGVSASTCQSGKASQRWAR